MIRELHTYQTFDPARGSFLVHPIAVGKPKPKKKMCSDGVEREVFRAANHVIHTKNGVSHESHPNAIDFVFMD